MKPDSGVMTCLRNFVMERQRIYILRGTRAPKPWTQDPILQRYKFCNVYREQDKVTKWIHQNIRTPFKSHPHLWFMLCIARQINWPNTLKLLMSSSWSWPIVRGRWSWSDAEKTLRSIKDGGAKVYGGAYIISGSGSDGRGKIHLTCKGVLKSLWDDHEMFETAGLEARGRTLADVHAALLEYPGWGDFLAAQVVADLKYTRYLRHAPDWWDWAVLGPGSRRGLNRLVPGHQRKNGIHTSWNEDEAMAMLRVARDDLSGVLTSTKMGTRLCLQDTQNCLCEFDKYERTRRGEGRPRATFDGLGETS